jgi:hypothetical protein
MFWQPYIGSFWLGRNKLMRNTVRTLSTLAIVMFVAASCVARAGSPTTHGTGSIAIVFKDGHRQSLELADITRIDFKTPITIVFKDGHQQNIAAADVARIDFEDATIVSGTGRAHFMGKWKVGEGNGRDFYITLGADGNASKSIGPAHGSWTVVDGEARIAWDDGWHDAIRKTGATHEKFAYEPGKSFDEKPSNVTAAVKTEAEPI